LWAEPVCLSPPNAESTCGGTVTAVQGTTTWSLSGGTLTGDSCSVVLSVTTPLGTGSATNTLPANAVTTAEGVTNGSQASVTIVRIETSVSITKAFLPEAVQPTTPRRSRSPSTTRRRTRLRSPAER
jgi:hypothetical protein